MDTYSFLREFADSWFLVLMTAFFLGTIGWVFRPRANTTYRDTASIPFRHENKPACQNSCDGCHCAKLADLLPEDKK